MKHSVISNALLAIAAFASSSCAMEDRFVKENQKASFTHPITVNFTSGDADTKAAFGEFDETSQTYPAYWTSQDKHICMSLNMAEPVEAEVALDKEVSNYAKFSATFEDSGKPYVFYALSPSSAVISLSPSREGWILDIPTVQTPKADGLSCDESAMLLWAKSESFDALPTQAVPMTFQHVTSYCRLTLKNLAQALSKFNVEDASVKSVDVTFSVPVAGNWCVNTSDGSIEEKESSHTITIIKSVEDNAQPAEIWFAMAPVSLNGQSVTVSVNTDKGCLARAYTFGNRTYEAGKVNQLSLDMSKYSVFDEFTVATEETVFQLVTSVDDISAGDEVIFVNAATPAYAMTKTANGTSGIRTVAKDATGGFTYSTEDKYIRLPEDSNVAVLTVASKNGTSVTFKNGSNYLTRSTSGSTHYLSYGTSSFTFTLAASSNGNSSVSYKSSTGTTTYSAYYSSSYFKISSSRSSTLKTMAIYKKTTLTNTVGIDPDNDPILQQEEYGAYLAKESIVHSPGDSQLSCELIDDTVTFAILYPSENTVLEFSDIPQNTFKGHKFELNLTLINGRKKEVKGTFEVTVVKEDGAKLWLSDFKGNGFIIRR